jgi:dihydrofolate synthase/folylpolyglutamate synthase
MGIDWSKRVAEVTEELISRQPENQIRPRLEPTRRAAEILGNPQTNYGIIHITGTNGKTTTARIIERILREHGLRTGRLTSPHLVSINERIAIDGEPIDDEIFVRAYEESKPLLELADAELVAEGEQPLTFFEAFTALAFQIFSDAPVDVLVLEVGMGGEWDSTNVADADVAVLTSISIDHAKSLGNTVSEIAKTKSGIIKPKSLVVTSPQDPEALKQIRLASESSEGLFEAGEKFSLIQVKPDGTGTRFTVKGIAGSYENLWMPIIGEHQAENAATAIATVELLLGAGQRPIGDEILRSALADSTSPGRLQIVSKDPLIVLDGAHNPAGAKTLAQAIRTHFGSPRAIGLISMLADKDARSTLTELKNLFEILVVTQVENQRRMPASQLADVALELGYKNVVVKENLSEALDYAKNNAVADALALFATGSLYMVGDLLKHFSSRYEMDDDGEN